MGGAGRDGVTAAGLGRGLKQQMKQRVRDIALYPLFQQTEMVTQILIMLSRIKTGNATNMTKRGGYAVFY